MMDLLPIPDDSMEPDARLDLLRQLDTSMKAIRKELLQQLADALASTGWSPHELAILDNVHRGGPLTQTELAARLMLDPAAISRIVAKLRDDGHVQTDVDPADRRARRVSLTASGQQLYGETLYPLFRDVMLERFAGVTDAQLHRMLSSYREVATALGITLEPGEG